MSKPVKEISKGLLNCHTVKISTADLILGFPIEAPLGSHTAPSYSFASNLECGFCLDSAGMVFVVDAQVGLVSGPHGNVAVGGTPLSYGGGEGVLFLAQSTVAPVGIPNDGTGGIIYTTDDGLWYLNASGLAIKLSEGGAGTVSGPVVSTENELARYADVTGNAITRTGVFYRSAQLHVGVGNVTTPAYAFTSHPSTGMYSPAANELALVANATPRLSISDAGTTCHMPVRVPNGTAPLPTLTFSSASTSGLYFSGADVGFSVQGVHAMQVSPLGNTVLCGDGNNFGTNARGVLKIPTATTVPVGVPNEGSGGLLYVHDMKLWWLNASGVSIRVGGDLAGGGPVATNTVAVWNDTTGTAVASRGVITDAGAVYAHQSATLTTPAYSFLGDPATGLALANSNTLRFMGGSITFLDMTSSSLSFYQQVLFDTSMSFTASSTTGLYSTGENVTTIAVNGTSAGQWDAERNVTLVGAGDINYANGQGVIMMAAATTIPTSAPIEGAFLYVRGNDLCWRASSNAEFILTTPHLVTPASTSTPETLVRFDGTSGTAIKSSLVHLTDQGQVQTPRGYCFVASPTSGIFSTISDTLRLVNDDVTAASFQGTGMSVENGHVLQLVDGSVSSPAISFSSNQTCGMHRATTNTGALGVNGVQALAYAPDHNIAFGSDTPDFAGGQGVVYFSEVTTRPFTTFASGGMLYVAGRTLFFYNDQGVLSTLTGVRTPSVTTPNAVARWDGSLGQAIQNTSSVTITDGGQILVPNGTTSAPGYTVVNTTGISLNANTLQFGVGAAALSINSSVVETLVTLQADNGIRIGGSTGTTISYAAPAVVYSVAAATGTFSWHQNSTPIMQTKSNGTLDLLTHAAVFSGATGTLTFGAYSGSSYSITTSSLNDSVTFRHGTTDVLTVGNGVATVSTVETLGNFRAPYTGVTGTYGFTATGNSAGLDMGSGGIRLMSKAIGFVARASSQVGLLVNTGNGNRTVAWGAAITPPASLPSNGVFMYQSDGSLMRVANAHADVAVNGPHARAKWTRTTTVSSGVDTLINTLVNDATLTNVLTVNTAVGTITGTAFTAGWWQVAAQASWAFHATGYRAIRIFVDSVEVAASVQNAVTASGVNTQHHATACVQVGTNAVMTVRVYQTSPGDLQVTVTASAVLLG